MKYAVFSADGLEAGFYSIEFHSAAQVPSDSVPITDDQWLDWLDHPGARRWDGDAIVPYAPPTPPLNEGDYTRAIQAHLDAQAQTRGYDSIQSAVTYMDDPNPTYAAEAAALRGWRSAVWTYALAELARVQAGEREQPGIEDLLAELPPPVWPGAT